MGDKDEPTIGLGHRPGHQFGKSGLAHLGQQLLAEASAGYGVTAPHAGQAESEPDAWWTATVVAVRECLQRADSAPAAIGLSGQMHGVVLTDDSGCAIRPAILWADSRATDEVAAYRRLPARVTRTLMNPLTPGMAGPMLLWLAAHEPGHYADATWALQPKDWLRLRLTGLAASDPSDASATLLYDVPADRWHVELIDALGLDSGLLPDLASSAGLAGSLTRAAADSLGLAAETPVVTGAADTAAGIVGAGLIPGQVQMSVGTGIQVVTLRNEAVPQDHPVTHLYRTAEDEGWYAMAAILNGGLALNWVRGLLAAEWSELYASATLPGRLDRPDLHSASGWRTDPPSQSGPSSRLDRARPRSRSNDAAAQRSRGSGVCCCRGCRRARRACMPAEDTRSRC